MKELDVSTVEESYIQHKKALALCGARVVMNDICNLIYF